MLISGDSYGVCKYIATSISINFLLVNILLISIKFVLHTYDHYDDGNRIITTFINHVQQEIMNQTPVADY